MRLWDFKKELMQSLQKKSVKKKAADNASAKQAKTSQESIDSYIRSLNPVLSRLHVIDYLKEAERKARQIRGNPPKEYRNMTELKIVSDNTSNDKRMRILQASACAGIAERTGFRLNYIDTPMPAWTFNVFVFDSNGNKTLRLGGSLEGIKPIYDGQAGPTGGTARLLSEWTPKSIEDEIFDYFNKTLLS